MKTFFKGYYRSCLLHNLFSLILGVMTPIIYFVYCAFFINTYFHDNCETKKSYLKGNVSGAGWTMGPTVNNSQNKVIKLNENTFLHKLHH